MTTQLSAASSTSIRSPSECSPTAMLLAPKRWHMFRFFFSSRRRHTSSLCDWSSDVCSSDLLALDYLKRTNQRSPKIEATARQYIHLGYQRLLGFEVQGGGFDWYGRPPANLTLTAYGLMEFEDMARVHDVDPALIARTREWLLGRRRPDGSWEADHRLPRGENALGTTAYVALAVFGGRPDPGRD